jgi:hypothetical protein
MQSSALMMTYHSGEDVIAFGMPSAKRKSFEECLTRASTAHDK